MERNNMNIDWQKIEEKYPMSYHKFIKQYDEIYDNGLLKVVKTINAEENINDDVCFCDFEKFFDENGIIIEIINWKYKKEYMFYINFPDGSFESGKYNSRQETKIEAVYKAFEIMEGQIL